jgi:hypothetical protein
MNQMNQKENGHSADVRIYLSVNGLVLPVAQLGPDFLILRKSTSHPPAQAEISMSVDGDEERWKIHLPEGIAPEKVKTRIGPYA